jgi:hypothetical protein
MKAEAAGSGSVIRYVATYVNGDGMRTLMNGSQGRYTFATAKKAQAWINAVTENNSADTLREAWGTNPRFEVRPCPCWPSHYDPQTIWFDCDRNFAMDPQAAIRELLELIKARDTEAAREQLDYIAEWINKGGFVPAAIDKAIEALRP